MISTRQFALIFGIVYVLVGILGFVPGITQPPPAGSPSLVVASFYGFILTLFAINILHNLFHIVVGAVGLAVSRNEASARLYCRVLAVIFVVLTVFGLVPALQTTFGLIPLFGLDVALHALTAVALAYFGWAAAPVARVAPAPAGRSM